MEDNHTDRFRSSPEDPEAIRRSQDVEKQGHEIFLLLSLCVTYYPTSVKYDTSYTQTWKFGQSCLRLNCFELMLVFCFPNERADRTVHKRSTFISWQVKMRSALSVKHNSLVVRSVGAKAEGPVFSLTLSPLMTTAKVFTEVNRSYLVIAVDTSSYWAHRQLRADSRHFITPSDEGEQLNFGEHWACLYHTSLYSLKYNPIILLLLCELTCLFKAIPIPTIFFKKL